MRCDTKRAIPCKSFGFVLYYLHYQQSKDSAILHLEISLYWMTQCNTMVSSLLIHWIVHSVELSLFLQDRLNSPQSITLSIDIRWRKYNLIYTLSSIIQNRVQCDTDSIIKIYTQLKTVDTRSKTETDMDAVFNMNKNTLETCKNPRPNQVGMNFQSHAHQLWISTWYIFHVFHKMMPG